MTTYFISRHFGAIDWAMRQGIKVDFQLAHLDVEQIQSGDVVIGSLPVNLAAEVCARNAKYIHLTLDLPYDARGVELDAAAMQRFGAKLEEYRISKVTA
jgi:CRISPR-associated protein Csx16